jgi:hypothetical protein
MEFYQPQRTSRVVLMAQQEFLLAINDLNVARQIFRSAGKNLRKKPSKAIAARQAG